MTDTNDRTFFVFYVAAGVFAIYWIMHLIMVSQSVLPEKLEARNMLIKFIGRKLCKSGPDKRLS